jgi:Kef-type K+ transport system membrane component KefB
MSRPSAPLHQALSSQPKRDEYDKIITFPPLINLPFSLKKTKQQIYKTTHLKKTMVKEVLLDVSLIIGLVAILTIVARLIKQPPIIAYLLSGILIGPLFLGYLNPEAESAEIIKIFSSIGVALLLFIVGLSLDLRVLKSVGKISTLTGLGQVAIMMLVVFLVSTGLGFSNLTSLYLAVALAFSSTVVVIKILSDKKELDSLHGHIAIGILIVQDILAALALLLFPLIDKGSPEIILLQLGKILALIIGVFLIAHIILKKVLENAAKNQEVLFISGIAWALIVATLFDSLGLSLEIGALIAGMSIASSKYTLEIGGKLKPLRDFFIILFFVYFGSLLVPPVNTQLILTALLFSVLVFICNPFLIMTLMRIGGYKNKFPNRIQSGSNL